MQKQGDKNMKKTIVFLLAIIILSTFVPVAAEENLPPPLLLGDVDGDLAITTTDAMLILRYVLTGVNDTPHSSFPTRQADINNDDVIDIKDALFILRFAMGLTMY